MKKTLLTVSMLMAMSVQIQAQTQTPDYLDDIMLQSFGWDEYNQSRNTSEGGLYEFYASRAGNLKALGFDMIWMPPASHSTGGVGYFPTELFNFSSTAWGTEAQLKKMLSNMNARGIYPIADVVANHRSGTTGWTDFTNPTWGCDAIVINDEATAAFDAGTVMSCRPSGAQDTGDGFGGSRDIDHTNTTVQEGYKEFLSRLKALGFKGWRWDVAKGFAPQYFGMYIGDSQPYYSVGENWDGNVDNLKSWINGTYAGGATISGAFDFSLYYNLSNTFASATANNQYGNLNWGGAMAGLAGQYGFAEKAVTFVDNHDTFIHGSAFLGNNIPKAYTYILTHPGIPSVFAPHYFGGTYSKDGVTRNYTSEKAIIDKLMAIRKTSGIDAWSHIVIDKSETGLYAAYIKKRYADTDAVIAMKIGPNAWTPSGEGWNQIIADNEYAVWTKSAINVAPTIQIQEPSTTYLTGSTQNITITASDDSGVAPTIRYTLDGTEPNATSSIYTGPVSISSATVLKAVAFDNANLSSGVVERNYNFADGGIVVKFKSEGTNWSNSFIHYWGVQPTGVMADANWSNPVAMTYDANTGWYSFSFTGATSANFLFRNEQGNSQTGDITNVTQNSCYVWDTSVTGNVRSVNCDSVLSTSDLAASKTTFGVENPAKNGVLKVNYSNLENGVAYLYDMTGKLVKTFKLSQNSHVDDLNINGLATGNYILKIQANGFIQSHKVIVK